MPSTGTVRSPRGKLNRSTPPGCTAPARPIACAIAAESSGTTGPRAVRSKLDPKTVAGPGAISPPRQAGSEAAASHSKHLVTITHLHVKPTLCCVPADAPLSCYGSPAVARYRSAALRRPISASDRAGNRGDRHAIRGDRQGEPPPFGQRSGLLGLRQGAEDGPPVPREAETARVAATKVTPAIRTSVRRGAGWRARIDCTADSGIST